MFERLRNKLRTVWYALSQVPAGFFGGYHNSEYYLQSPRQRYLHGPEQALTLSPFWAGMRLYQQSISVLPLVTYQKDADGGRHRYQDKATYTLLHDRPNPAMSRAAFWEYAIWQYYSSGEFFAMIQWAGNHRLLGLYPVPSSHITKIEIDDQWNKLYFVNGYDEPFTDDEMIHVTHFSTCGLRGTPFIRYAGEALGLHKQVQESATAYYANAARPSGYIKFPGKLSKQAAENTKTTFRDSYQGTHNTGNIPYLEEGGEFNPFTSTGAADAQIIEAIGSSVDDIARWYDNLSPLILGNVLRGTYSNDASAKLAFYQKNLLPILEKFQLELNHKLFGSDSDTYCEFLTDNVLRADPETQSRVWHNGVIDGYLLRSEIRQWLNLPPVEGLDEALQPQNMGVVGDEPVTPEPVTPQETNATDTTIPLDATT